MNPETMDIQKFQSKEEAFKKGFSISLQEEEFKKLKPMNRKQRRAWLRKSKKQKRVR